MIFKDAVFLFLLPLPLLLIYILKKSANKGASFRFSSSFLIDNLKSTWKAHAVRTFFILRTMAVVFIIFAIARPQEPVKGSPLNLKGIDIILAIDCSASMLAEDFKQNNERISRLNITRSAVKDFTEKRQGDRIGVVAFGAYAYIACPLTIDYNWAATTIDALEADISENSTSIGYAIATSLNRLKSSKAKSKVIILVTDGRNNAGDISPQTAAEIAKTLNVKIYTVGVGSKGLAPYPFREKSGKVNYKNISIDLDEDTLKKISEMTNGKYFRAADTDSLNKIYKEINNMEKSDIRGKRFSEYDEVFYKFLFIAIGLLLLEIILKGTILRTLP